MVSCCFFFFNVCNSGLKLITLYKINLMVKHGFGEHCVDKHKHYSNDYNKVVNDVYDRTITLAFEMVMA